MMTMIHPGFLAAVTIFSPVWLFLLNIRWRFAFQISVCHESWLQISTITDKLVGHSQYVLIMIWFDHYWYLMTFIVCYWLLNQFSSVAWMIRNNHSWWLSITTNRYWSAYQSLPSIILFLDQLLLASKNVYLSWPIPLSIIGDPWSINHQSVNHYQRFSQYSWYFPLLEPCQTLTRP